MFLRLLEQYLRKTFDHIDIDKDIRAELLLLTLVIDLLPRVHPGSRFIPYSDGHSRV
jgi:hypothetical protein